MERKELIQELQLLAKQRQDLEDRISFEVHEILDKVPEIKQAIYDAIERPDYYTDDLYDGVVYSWKRLDIVQILKDNYRPCYRLMRLYLTTYLEELGIILEETDGTYKLGHCKGPSIIISYPVIRDQEIGEILCEDTSEMSQEDIRLFIERYLKYTNSDSAVFKQDKLGNLEVFNI